MTRRGEMLHFSVFDHPSGTVGQIDSVLIKTKGPAIIVVGLRFAVVVMDFDFVFVKDNVFDE